MEIIDQKILHDSVRWPSSPEYGGDPLFKNTRLKKDTIAGDIVVTNSAGDKLFVPQNLYAEDKAKWTEKGYEPIAVVVVPASHTDDGTARCMALNAASYNDPEYGQHIDDGSSYIGTIYWNNNSSSSNFDIPSLPSFPNGFNYKLYGSTTVYQAYYVGFSSDSTAWNQQPSSYSHDPLAPFTRTSPYLSPYGEDGISKNSNFYIEGGFCEEMDGKYNTAKIVKNTPEDYVYRNPIPLWSDYAAPGHHAAVLCFRYHTKGTQQGDWYLPAVGELAYLLVRVDKITNGISSCGGDERIRSYTGGGNSAWTSSEYDTSSAYYILFAGGNINKMGKGASNACFPFIKI